MPYNGYSEEYLDRLENGSLPVDNKSFNKRKFARCLIRQNRFSLSPLCPSLASLFIAVISRQTRSLHDRRKWEWNNRLGRLRVGRNVGEESFPIIWNFVERKCDKWKQCQFCYFYFPLLLASMSARTNLSCGKLDESTFDPKAKRRWWDISCWDAIELSSSAWR